MKRYILVTLVLLAALVGVPTAEATPGTPTGVTVWPAVSTSGSGNVAYNTVYWTPVTGATSYKVYRQTLQPNGSWSPTAPGTLVYTDAFATGEFNDWNLSRVTTYRYHVSAVDGSGEGAKSTDTSINGGVTLPFTRVSPWNSYSPLDFSDASVLTSDQRSQLGGGDTVLHLSGLGPPPPPVGTTRNCGYPVWFDDGNAPTVAYSAITGDKSWSPSHDWNPTGSTIPVPVGSYPENCNLSSPGGDDAHIATVNAARTTSYEFWNVRQGGWDSDSSPSIVMGDSGGDPGSVSKIDLLGQGYSNFRGSGSSGENSSRGSGVPALDTAIRPEELQYGISHAIGCTIDTTNIAADPKIPASKSDGSYTHTTNGVHDELHYGDRLILDPSFSTSGLTVGEAHIIQALQAYGCFLTDRGGQEFEIDAFSFNDPAGLIPASMGGTSSTNHDLDLNNDGPSGSAISVADFRLATP